MSRKTLAQRTKIKRALERGERITAKGSRRRWKCDRLAARIFELRKQGMDIETTYKVRLGQRFGVYSLDLS